MKKNITFAVAISFLFKKKKKILYLWTGVVLLLFLSAGLRAQTSKPGGTTLDVKLWLAADKLNGTNLLQNNATAVNSWVDLSGNGLKLRGGGECQFVCDC